MNLLNTIQMKTILISEICNEKPNSSALGAYNRAVDIVSSGRSGGESLQQVFNYLKKPASQRRQESIDAFERNKNIVGLR